MAEREHDGQVGGEEEEEYRLVVSPEELEVIRQTLVDRSLTMAQRYRAVFTLRNIGGDKAVEILAEGAQKNNINPIYFYFYFYLFYHLFLFFIFLLN